MTVLYGNDGGEDVYVGQGKGGLGWWEVLLRKKVFAGGKQRAVVMRREERYKQHILDTLSRHTYITKYTMVTEYR